MISKRLRSAAVTVEFAFALPVFFTFVLAGVEFARVNVIRNSMENAVYEGARRGIVPGATVQDCVDEVQAMLDIIGVVGATITVDPDPLTASATSVQVTVDVPLTSQNGYITPQFYLGRTLTSSITLRRERPM